jgi:hypothetical protein
MSDTVEVEKDVPYTFRQVMVDPETGEEQVLSERLVSFSEKGMHWL